MADFWELVHLQLQDPTTRGNVAAGLIVLLSIPKRALGVLLAYVPRQLLPREGIPAVLAIVGWFGGLALGHFTPLPTDLAIAVGVGAGWGAGSTHDAIQRMNKGGSR